MGAGDEEAEELPGSLLVTKVDGKDPGKGSGSPRWAPPGSHPLQAPRWALGITERADRESKEQKHRGSRCLGRKEVIWGRKF